MKSIAIAVVLVVFASQPLIAVQLKSSQEVQHKNRQGEQNPKANQCGTDDSPCSVKILPPPENKEEAKQKAEDEKHHAMNEQLTAWATVAMAAITFFLAIFTALLWWITRKLAQDAKEASTKAMELADANTQALINVERAWILAGISWYEKKGVNIAETTTREREGATEESTTIFLKLTCVNDGKSPAWIEQVYTHLEIITNEGDSFVDETGERDRQNLRINGRIGALGAGKDISTGIQLRCVGRRKNTDRDLLNAFVVIEYYDIFKIKRETTLGYSITFEGEIVRQDACRDRNRNT